MLAMADQLPKPVFVLPVGLPLPRTVRFYIADTANHRIRRVGRDGIITTIAGTGVAGSPGDGGLAVDAYLHSPRDVAFWPRRYPVHRRY